MTEQQTKLETLKKSTEQMIANWGAENSQRLAEVRKKMMKYRIMPGDEAKIKHKEFHKLKCKISQSRPKIEDVDILKILTSPQVEAYQKELNTLKFWYGGHGEYRRTMMLVAAGATPEEAIELFENFVTETKKFKDMQGNGKKYPQPSYPDIIKELKLRSASKYLEVTKNEK